MHLVVNALDRAVTVTVTAEVAKAGEAVVRASALAGLIRGFPKDSTVEIDADAHGARIRCGRARYKLPVMPVEQLPPVPAIDVVTGEIELDRKELLEAIKQVVFAASTEETRYYMNGILFHDREIASPWSRPTGTGWQSARSRPRRSRRITAALFPTRRSLRSSSCSPRPRPKTCGCGDRKVCSKSARPALSSSRS